MPQRLTALFPARDRQQSFRPDWRPWLLLLLVSSSGCTQIPTAFLKPPANAEFKLQVTPQAEGVYMIAGNTNFPENSKVAVAAIRYLYPATQAAQTLKPAPTYSVLDYQLVEVQHGQWQTTLNLWQPAGKDRQQEAWQFDQAKLGVAFKPASDVVFLASVAPVNQVEQLRSLEAQLAKRNLKLNGSWVHTTVDGQQYVQISQTQPLPLPPGSNAPPSPRPEPLNGGWGNRFVIPQEPQNPDHLELPPDRRTNAPAAPQEFLQ